MIIRVPKYKKINESFFDDIDDDISVDVSDVAGQTAIQIYEEETVKPMVEKLLNMWHVQHYTITCTGNGVVVDVNDDLNLSYKKLNQISFKYWGFGTVTGNVNYTGNKLANWDKFPREIKGSVYANNNYLKNFNNAPIIHGNIIASKQLCKSDYILTKQNYLSSGSVTENSVYVISKNAYGELTGINEEKQYCTVKLQNDKHIKCKLDDVDCLDKITNLLV